MGQLLFVPNFSEGRSERVVDALAATLAGQSRVLNVHFDPRHNRAVYTVSGEPDELVKASAAAAEHALELIDLRRHDGLHPHVGALDVAPFVWIT